MQNREARKILKDLQNKLNKLVIRSFIQSVVSDYDENATYIVYDNSRVELFNESFFEVNKNFKHIKNYLISKPFKA